MADINAGLLIPEYVTDFGTRIQNLGFKILNRYANSNIAAGFYADRPGSTACGSSGLFQTRYFEVTFIANDGEDVIKFPIPTREQSEIQRMFDLIRQNPNVTCISYFGERWPRVPSSLLGDGVNYNPNAAYEVSSAGNRLTGIYRYVSEGLGSAIFPGYALEALPVELQQPRLDCLQDPVPNAVCAEATNIRPRRLIGQARKLRNGAIVSGSVVRSAPVSRRSSGGLLECATILAPLFLCLGYEGEQVLNVSALRT